ncbi:MULTISPECIES: MMPL family transporter [Paenibacillus]|uniref:Transporter n=1 Tax=Paenibacillus albilobatus TaxID=2716884 RepID=A0A919XAL1_9BACL|nr:MULTISPECIES: MMPL family transporter [Paenibacillus]GIO29106.1 transporter [Paenibacillus albilobatus]
MGERLYRFVYRHSGAIVACWTAIFIMFGSFSAMLPSVVKGPGLYTCGSAYEVQQLMKDRFGMPEDPIIVVFEKQGTVSDTRFSAVVRSTLEKLGDLHGMAFMMSPLEHDELMVRDAAYAMLGFDPSSNGRDEIKQIRDRLPRYEDISVALTGKTVVQEDVNQASMEDFERAERFGIPLAFLVLLFSFGGFFYALMPVLMGLLSVSTAMGLVAVLGRIFDLELSNFVLNVIPMTGLALCLDFAFIVINRFREELEKESLEKALETAMRTSGRAVYFSTVCVLCGLAAVALIPMPMFRSAAFCAMLTVILAAAVNLSLVPALLLLFSPWLKRKRFTSAFHRRSYKLWAFWADIVMGKPGRMLVAACCILLLLVLPAFRLTTAVPDASSLPPGTASREADEAIRNHFRQNGISEVLLAVQSANGKFTLEEWREIAGWIKQIQKDLSVTSVKPWLESVQSNLKSSANATALFRISLMGEPGSSEVNEWLRVTENKAKQAGLRIELGGEAKSRQEVVDAIADVLPNMLLLIAGTNALVLFAAFRSVLIPLKAILMNMLSIAASFGVLVIVFQSGIAGKTPENIAIMVPVFVFGLVFGVSMDYGVFLLSRMSEAFWKKGDVVTAIREGLASTGKLITAAAAILIAVTLPFAFGKVEGVRQLGVGIAAAVFIDATLVRLLMVPSLMKLLGHFNWWVPRWFRSR